METEKHYFDQAKKLAPEVSLHDVELFVLQGPQAPSFWKSHFFNDLNSIIMSITAIFSIGLYLFVQDASPQKSAKPVHQAEKNLDIVSVVTQQSIEESTLEEINIAVSELPAEKRTSKTWELREVEETMNTAKPSPKSNKQQVAGQPERSLSSLPHAPESTEDSSGHAESSLDFQAYELLLFGDEPTSSWNPKVLQAKENGMYVQVSKIKRHRDGTVKKIEFYLKAKSPEGKNYYKSFVSVQCNSFQSLAVTWKYNPELGVEEAAYSINEGTWKTIEDVYHSCSKIKISSK